MSDKITILLMSTDQLGIAYMRLGEEVREIYQGIQVATFRDSFDLKVHPATQLPNLDMLLLNYAPHVVHFSGHGTPSGGIILEGEDENAIPVGVSELASILRILKDNIRLVFLNVCYSNNHAEAIAQVIDYAIGVNGPIEDKSAITFASSFYRTLAFGRSIREAFDLASERLAITDPLRSGIPVLHVRQGVDAQQPFLFQEPKSRSVSPQFEPEAALQQLGSQFAMQLRIAGHFRDTDDTEHAIYLDNNLYVHRKLEEKALFDQVEKFARTTPLQGKWVSVTGDAGHGKSSLLWYLYDHLKNDQRLRIAPFLGQLEIGWSRIEATVLRLKHCLPASTCLVVIIDTLDILVGIDDPSLTRMLNALRSAGCLVITSSRKQEVEQLFKFSPSDDRVDLRRYNNEEAQQTIRNYINLAHPSWSDADRSRQFDDVWGLVEQQRDARELDLEPLILRMLFEAYIPNQIPRDINTQAVYKDYWIKRVLFDRAVKDADERHTREQLCCLIARQAAFGAGQSDKLSVDTLRRVWEATELAVFPYSIIEGLVSTGVLQWAEGASTVRFFHQTFFEYTAAYDLLSSEESFIENGIRILLEDVTKFNFFRAPILKQLGIQSYKRSPNIYRRIMQGLRDVNNELTALMALEIVGKLPHDDYAFMLCKDWIKEDGGKLQGIICETVRHYPRNKTEVALDLLEPYLDGPKAKAIYKLCEETFAKDAPAHVHEFLHRRLLKIINASDDEKTHYREALCAVLQAGVIAAFDDLMELFSHLKHGQQSGLLYKIAEICIEGNVSMTVRFLKRIIAVIKQSKKPKQAEVWDGVLQVARRLQEVEPSAAKELAQWLLHTDFWKDDQIIAQYTGMIAGLTVSDPLIVHQSLLAIASDNHSVRLLNTGLLCQLSEDFHAGLMTAILSLKKDQYEADAQIGSLFNIVASLKNIAPGRILQFLDEWPWLDSGVGTPLRRIMEYLAEADPAATKTWLFRLMPGGAGPGGDKVFSAFNILSQVNINVFEATEVRQLYDLAFQLSKAIKQRFAGMIGSIVKLDPELADEIFARLFTVANKDCQVAAINSLAQCINDNYEFVLKQSGRVLKAALSTHSLGLLHSYLIVLKRFPRPHALFLLRHLNDWLSETTLQSLRDEKAINELLAVLKIFAEANPRLAFDFSKRLPLISKGVAGGLAALYDRISQYSDEASLLSAILESVAIVSRFNQVRMKNALRRTLPRLDQKLGGRKVVEMVLRAYKDIHDEEALKTFIEAALRVSWTAEEVATLLQDAELPGSVRSILSAQAKR
jgi:hypothetical protein